MVNPLEMTRSMLGNSEAEYNFFHIQINFFIKITQNERFSIFPQDNCFRTLEKEMFDKIHRITTI